MPTEIAADHPKQKLLFFVAQDIDDGTRVLVEELVNRLVRARSWVNGAPQFVDEIEEGNEEWSLEDLPIETVGGYIELYSAHPPWKVPRELDKRHFEEVAYLVDSLRDASRQHGLAFELELDGAHVGSITGGRIDRLLAEGLIEPWRRNLEEVPAH